MAVKKTTRAKKVVAKSKKTKSEAIESSVSLSTGSKGFFSRDNLLKKFFSILIIAGVVVLLYFGSKYMVVAWVDQQPISRIEYYSMLESRFGKDVREQLIIEKLLFAEAKKRGKVVSQQEIDGQVKKIADSQGGQAELVKALKIDGRSIDELKKYVKLQMLRDKMFGEGVMVKDEDVSKYIEDNKQAVPDPVTDEVKTAIKEQLRQDKISKNYNDWLKSTIQSPRVIRS